MMKIEASKRLQASETYQVGQEVETKVGGKWIPAVITKPMNSAGNYGIRFMVGKKPQNYLASTEELRPAQKK